VIARQPLRPSTAGAHPRAAIRLASTALTAPTVGGRPRGISTCSRILTALMLWWVAAPAGAVLIDGPCNDAIIATGPCAPGAPIQMVKSGPVTIDAGELELVAGDIDFVGIAGLSTDDIVTVTTTPLDPPADPQKPQLFQEPNTIVGLFESTTTDPTTMILCRGDNTANNDQDNCPGGDCPGWGSLCRFRIQAPGDYFVGVTGYRPKFPGGCTPGATCSSYPFDGGIGATPCTENFAGDDTDTCGNYQVTIGVWSLPEPGLLFQLASGCLGLLVLDRRRRSANR